MAYIYKITNILNNKVYIGMTINTIKERWEQHCNESLRERGKDRPLYRAINKYGKDSFLIEELEFIENENQMAERERYWIEYFGSFKNGYNATLGGDGKPYLDYGLIVKTYLEVGIIKKVAELLNIDAGHISTVLRIKSIPLSPAGQALGIKIAMLTLDNEIIKVFPTLSDAARYLIQENLASGVISSIRTHIKEVADGKRKIAYRHKWKLI